MAGLTGVAHEALQERQRLVPEVHLLHDEAAQLEDAKPQAVAAAARVALDQAGGVQVDQEAVDGGLVQPTAGRPARSRPSSGSSAENALRIATARSIAWIR